MTQTPDIQAPVPRPPLRPLTRIVLILSLGLNLAVFGIVAGVAINHSMHPPRAAVRDLGFGPFTEALTPADRHALYLDFRASFKDFDSQRQQMRADMDGLVASLHSDPFDVAGFQAVMARMKTRTDERLAVGQKLLIDHIQAMTPADRSAFADRLQDVITHHRKGGGRPDAPPPPPPGN